MFRRTGLITFGVAIVCMVLSAAQPIPSCIEDLWGFNITLREFLERVDPSALYRVPRDALDTRITWGEDTLTFHWIGTDDSDKLGDVEAALNIVVSCTNAIDDLGDRNVYFGASSTVIIPPFLRMPYMSVDAYLLQNGWPIAHDWDDGENVWRVTCNDTEDVYGQCYYQTMSIHITEAPPGYEPPYQSTVRYSPRIWVD